MTNTGKKDGQNITPPYKTSLKTNLLFLKYKKITKTLRKTFTKEKKPR